ncbi:MAG: NAD-dependent epimerase/dehydratase family protein [Candidatus Cloacimonetes bacterium]|jgi:nucleoside-diphosphate-sugar epimerase|nr:NAD-dependent epimerase/dehydratase family protein [Candidatus Cloacimonadota bacterium]MDY0173037.1 NAD-dependent epimerase/dehydratase family protein [Candidatus Cloacimonadaceae bacterium]
MKIAITGANGFVGSTLLSSLQANDFKPIALVRRSFYAQGVAVREIDYFNPQQLSAALADVDVVIHNAGMTKSLSHTEMYAANIGLTQKIVSTINHIDHPIRLIYMSSQAASGPSTADLPRKESDPFEPISIYGKSKALAEKVIHEQCLQAYNIVRPCSIYGPQDRDFLQLFKLCKRGLSMQIGKEERLMNMIHVSQLADFIQHLILKNDVNKETFFASDNQIYTQAQVVQYISQAMATQNRQIIVPQALAHGAFALSDLWGRIIRRPLVTNLEKYKEITAEAWLVDSSKAQELLSWNPAPQMPELIKETYQWYISNGWL